MFAMTDDPHSVIKALARKCANADLNMRSARALFNALYLADAISENHGNIADATRFAGLDPGHYTRAQNGAVRNLMEELG